MRTMKDIIEREMDDWTDAMGKIKTTKETGRNEINSEIIKKYFNEEYKRKKF